MAVVYGVTFVATKWHLHGSCDGSATAGAALATLVGGVLFVACFKTKVEPPDILVRFTLIAVLLLAVALTLLPGDHAAS